MHSMGTVRCDLGIWKGQQMCVFVCVCVCVRERERVKSSLKRGERERQAV